MLEAESEGEARLTVAAVPSQALVVPPSLHASLLARLDRLGPAKEVAQIGAAIGREFSHALLAAVMRKSEVDLRSALDRLVAAGLLFRQGVPPHATYLFKHALVQDAAYGTLLREQRRALHVRIAETLENQFPEIAESQPEQLAQHCAEAGQINEAIDYWTKAGQTSLARSAMVEATRQVQKGLALLSGLVETPERQRKELALQTVLGVAQFRSKGEGALEVGEAFIRAHALCDQLGDRSNLGSVLYMQGSHSIARAQYAVALRLAEEQLNLAKERNDSVLELQAHLSVGPANRGHPSSLPSDSSGRQMETFQSPHPCSARDLRRRLRQPSFMAGRNQISRHLVGTYPRHATSTLARFLTRRAIAATSAYTLVAMVKNSASYGPFVAWWRSRPQHQYRMSPRRTAESVTFCL